MRSTFLAVVLAVMPTMGFAQFHGGHGSNPAETARELKSKMMQFCNEVAEERDLAARRYGYGSRFYQKYDAIFRAAERFGGSFDHGFMRDLRRNDARSAKRTYARSQRAFDQLRYEVEGARRLPWGLHQQFRQIGQKYSELGRQIDRMGGGHGGGHGGGEFAGSCLVVLETLWGTDVRDFYGKAFGPTASVATQGARQDGINQCERHRTGLLKCTVSGQCGAERIGRGGHGGRGGNGGFGGGFSF